MSAYFYFIEPVSPFNKMKSAEHPNGFTAKNLMIWPLKILWKNHLKSPKTSLSRGSPVISRQYNLLQSNDGMVNCGSDLELPRFNHYLPDGMILGV